MSDDSDASRRLFGFDAEEAARLAAEVQDLGFSTARMVVDRFVEMFERFRTDAASPGPASGGAASSGAASAGPALRARGDDGAYQRLQSDAQRALDSYFSVLRRLGEMSIPFFDAARPGGGSSTEAERLIVPDVAPGGRASARMWLHNTTGSAVTNLRPFTPGLTSHTGAVLPADAVTFGPARVQRLDPGASTEILVVVAVPEDAAPGTYLGQVLVEGIADAAFPVTARVVSAPGA